MQKLYVALCVDDDSQQKIGLHFSRLQTTGKSSQYLERTEMRNKSMSDVLDAAPHIHQHKKKKKKVTLLWSC